MTGVPVDQDGQVTPTGEQAPDDWYDDATRFAKAAGVASVALPRRLILASERSAHPVVLDPIETAIWELLDDDVTIGELVADLDAALEADEPTVRAHLAGLLWRLATGGCLDGVELPRIEARRALGRVDPDSCAGKRMGLGRAKQVQIRGPRGVVVRIGATDHELVDRLVAALPEGFGDEPVAGPPVPTFVLRSTAGRAPRLQQLFDSVGDRVVVTSDLDDARAALDRTLAGLLALDRGDGIWLDAPALLAEQGVVVIPPGMRPVVTERLMRPLAERGIGFVPSGLLRLELPANPGEELPVVVAPAGLLESTDERRWPLLAGVSRGGDHFVELVTDLVHFTSRWDDAHLAAARRLADCFPVYGLPGDVDAGRLLTELVDAFTREAPTSGSGQEDTLSP
jgi:hypothetical protein